MLNMLLVGAGGFIGSIFRYLLSGIVYSIFVTTQLPFGTLAVNIIGCLLIGFLGGLTEIRQFFNPQTRVFLMIGLLGGFTTFSTFGYETFNLIRDGQILAASMNTIFHLVGSIFAVWIGYSLSQLI